MTLFVVAGLAVSLTACSSSDPETEPSNSSASSECDVTATGDAADAVEVSGDFGAKPTVEFDFPLTTETTERAVVIEGDGDVAVAGDQVQIDFTMLNATDGTELTTTNYDETEYALFSIDDVNFLPGLAHTLECSSIGSRVVGVIPPKDSWQSQGQADLGVAATDSIVFVADVVAIIPTRATGEDQPVEDGFPEVTLAEDGTPTIVIPETDPPKETKVSVLKKGDGEVVESGDTVSAQYVGVIWRTGAVFQQTWGSGSLATLPTDGVVPGFKKALVGQTVGSQVLVVIPPADGYGEAGSPDAGIEGTDTIVFVVDILAK
jgi:FKBP-type peptidyl-prolyl cis-trans isomerase